MKEHVASAESRQRTSALLSDLWARNRPVIETRLQVLERACSDPLSEEGRVDAVDVAHKLAGSLGMFGFSEGTEIARKLEHLFETSPPCGAKGEVALLVGQLRCVLFGRT